MSDSLSVSELTKRLQASYDSLEYIIVPGETRLTMAHAEVEVETLKELSRRLNEAVLNINFGGKG